MQVSVSQTVPMAPDRKPPQRAGQTAAKPGRIGGQGALFRAQEPLANNLVERRGVRDLARDEKAFTDESTLPASDQARPSGDIDHAIKNRNRWAAKDYLRRVKRCPFSTISRSSSLRFGPASDRLIQREVPGRDRRPTMVQSCAASVAFTGCGIVIA
jgi:hypothetical protein